MTPGTDPAVENRLLLLPPTRRDGELTCQVLAQANVHGTVCGSLDTLVAELDGGAAALLIAEEVFARDASAVLVGWLERQPFWSDLPIILLARPGADSEVLARAVSMLSNVTVLDRPTRVAALVSAVRSAIRARRRQYQLREDLVLKARTEALLRESDRRKDEFLAILAHELRNPLAPIRTSLDLLKRPVGSDAQRELHGVIERQVDTMVRLVDDLLEVSRIARGVTDLQEETVDVVKVMRNAIEISQPLVTASRHRLSVDLPEPPLRLRGDPIRLAQVFSNLINNAAKYTPAGGAIAVAIRVADDRATVTVEDTGIGIGADMLGEVFGMFKQIREPGQGPTGGLGIGLTLAKRLVEQHGGTIRAESEGAGRGSRFVVSLPLLAAPAALPAAAIPAADFSLAGLRVLVADDNEDAAEALGRLIEILGGRCTVVHDGESVAAALVAGQPRVAFIDIGMPRMSGHDVARQVRGDPRFDGVALVALTGWGQQEDKRRSREAGFDAHLVKPVGFDTLQNTLAPYVAAQGQGLNGPADQFGRRGADG